MSALKIIDPSRRVALRRVIVLPVLRRDGSVVLTAGTAASGRFSTLASNSRDSESVLSAASVVRDTLDGASVVITREKTTAWERLRT